LGATSHNPYQESRRKAVTLGWRGICPPWQPLLIGAGCRFFSGAYEFSIPRIVRFASLFG
jgi:hypothetical protein